MSVKPSQNLSLKYCWQHTRSITGLYLAKSSIGRGPYTNKAIPDDRPIISTEDSDNSVDQHNHHWDDMQMKEGTLNKKVTIRSTKSIPVYT